MLVHNTWRTYKYMLVQTYYIYTYRERLRHLRLVAELVGECDHDLAHLLVHAAPHDRRAQQAHLLGQDVNLQLSVSEPALGCCVVTTHLRQLVHDLCECVWRGRPESYRQSVKQSVNQPASQLSVR